MRILNRAPGAQSCRPLRSLLVLCDLVGKAGGTERYLQHVIPALLHRGIDVRVLARQVQDPALFGALATELRWGEDTGRSVAEAVGRIAGELEETPVNAVLTSNVFDAGVLRAVIGRARLFVRVHDHRPFCPNGDRFFPIRPGICTGTAGMRCLANAFVRGCMFGSRLTVAGQVQRRRELRGEIARARGVLVSSRYMAEICVQHGIDPTRVSITAPPLPREAFGEPPRMMPQDRTVLFAGRIAATKGLSALIRALALIPEVDRPKLVVAGSKNAEVDELARLAAHSRVACLWRGWLDERALRSEIDAASLIAVPSLWAEPFGLVGIEAFARGRPVVGFDTGGIREWMGEGGVVVDLGNERELSQAIQRLLIAPNWQRHARAAFEQAKRFDIDRHVDRLVEILAS